MNSLESDKFKNDAMTYKVSPPDTAWFRLESRLEKHRSQKKIKIYKYLSYAAVMVTIIGMVAVFSHSIHLHNEPTLISDYRASNVSDLEINPSPGIYNASQLSTLKVAYQKLGSKN